jgi:excisionase family DNA binding protein
VKMQDISTLRPVVHELVRMFVDEVRSLLACEVSSTPDTMLPGEVAKSMKVSPKKVYDWIESGRLRAIDLNPPNAKRPRWSIDRADVEAFRKSLQPTPKAPRTPRRATTSSTKRY